MRCEVQQQHPKESLVKGWWKASAGSRCRVEGEEEQMKQEGEEE
jgi:hypothetical protein